MPLPLAIPVAIGAFDLAMFAVTAIAAWWATTPQGQEAGRAGMQALSEALSKPRSVAVPIAPSLPKTCEQPNCDDKCGPLLQQINKIRGELFKRIADMEVDKYHLYDIRPAALPNIGSWPGHIYKFRNKQAELRTRLTEAAKNGCTVPSDAWHLATRNPPNRPFRR